MVTSRPSGADADARSWAIRLLELDEPVERLDAAAMLRLVAKADYVLAPECIDAVQIVANPSSFAARSGPLELAAALGGHQRHHEVVASFIQQFFDFSCDERRRRWKSLVGDCAKESALALWLNRLEQGLDVELPPLTENSNFNHLIQACRDVFLSRPAKASRLRLEFCEMWRRDISTWEGVTDEALERHPRFFETVAPWVDEFRDLRLHESSFQDRQKKRLNSRRKRWPNDLRKLEQLSAVPLEEPDATDFAIPLDERDTIEATGSSQSADRIAYWGLRLALWMIIGTFFGNVVAMIRDILSDFWRW